MSSIKLSPAARATLIALVVRGPLDDGDVPSKKGRDELLELGFACKIVVKGYDGFQAATYTGRDAYKDLFPGPDGDPADTINEATVNREVGNFISSAQRKAATPGQHPKHVPGRDSSRGVNDVATPATTSPRVHQTQDLLELVSQTKPVPDAVLLALSEAELSEIDAWAAAVHFRASDNAVKVPPIPSVLRDYLI